MIFDVGNADDARLKKLELYAWVGEDEMGSGEIGLKQGMVPAGYIPLVATARSKIDRSFIESGLVKQSMAYGKRISLCRFVFAEVVKEITPDTFKGWSFPE